MRLTDYVFPEDPGINNNLTNDWTDAAQFGQLAFGSLNKDYVVSGMTFNVDYQTPSFELSGGVAKIAAPTGQTQDHSGDSPSRGQITLSNMVYAVDMDPKQNISLADNAVNHVYLNVDLSTDDTILVHVDTDETPPPEPSMKRGIINTSSNSSRLTNSGFFTRKNLTLTADVGLTVTHSLSLDYPNMTFYDGNDKLFPPSRVERLNEDQVEIEHAINVSGGRVAFGP